MVEEIKAKEGSAQGTGGAGTPVALPPDALIIVPVRNTVLFPGLVLPITLNRSKSVAAAQQAVREQRQVGFCCSVPPTSTTLGQSTCMAWVRSPMCCALSRRRTAPTMSSARANSAFRSSNISAVGRSWSRACCVPEPDTKSSEIEARFVDLKSQTLEAVGLLPQAPAEVSPPSGDRNPPELADLATAYMDVKPEEKQEILETVDIGARMDKVSRMLAHRIEVLRLSQEIGRQTKAALDERQREVLLREQMAAIQRQLGEGEEGKAAELAEVDKAITNAGMPKEVEDQARKELRRLQRMPDAAGEYGMVRTYLDWLIELPWKLARSSRSISPRRGAFSTRTTTTSRRSSGASSNIWRCASSRRTARPDTCASSARPASARPRSASRSHVRSIANSCACPRRRPRRGGNPRPSPDLYRRAARQHHPVDPQGRVAQLGDDARRDRQAWRADSTAIPARLCLKCSTPNRTTRSATIISRCRST